MNPAPNLKLPDELRKESHAVFTAKLLESVDCLTSGSIQNEDAMSDWITNKVIKIIAEQAQVAPEKVHLDDTIYDFVDVLFYDEAEPLAYQLAQGFQLPMDPIHLKIGGIDLVQELVDMIRKMVEG
jgi:hypothetical protein